MQLNKTDIKTIHQGPVRCDGTVNDSIELNNGEYIDLYGLSLKQGEQLFAWFQNKKSTTLTLDPRFLVRREKLFLSQNGIKGV